MAWCEANAVDYIFGLPGNAVLSRLLEQEADDVRVRRAEDQAPALRGYAETRYGAKSWGCKRRVSARIEATALGLDIRCVVTNLRSGQRRMALRHPVLRPRPSREPDQAAQGPTRVGSYQLPVPRSPTQFRLVLHTAAYWLMLTVRDAIPRSQPLASAEFATLRMRLLKIVGRITETATRVPHRIRRDVPRSRAVPRRRPQLAPRRTMTAGAIAPGPRLVHLNTSAQHLRPKSRHWAPRSATLNDQSADRTSMR